MPTAWPWLYRKRLYWRARQDSDLRPSASEADALSTELRARDSAGPVAETTTARDARIAAEPVAMEHWWRRNLGGRVDRQSLTMRPLERDELRRPSRIGRDGESRSGSRRSRFVAVPVKGRPAEADRLLPRYKGIYHVGCTDYPNPTYP
jgi:hypothetical protein